MTQWHQFLFPPWLKNAEHAGTGQLFFSRTAFFSRHSLAQMTLGFQETASKQVIAQAHKLISTIYSEKENRENTWIDVMTGESGSRFEIPISPISSWQMWKSLHKTLFFSKIMSISHTLQCCLPGLAHFATWIFLNMHSYAYWYSTFKRSVTLPCSALAVVSLINTRCQ